MRLIFAAALAWTLTATSAWALPSEAEEGLSAHDIKAVEEGEVVVHLRDTRESTLKDVRCVGIVKALPARIWSVLVDYEAYGKIFPRILKSEVRAKDGDSEDHYTLLDYPWPLQDRWTVNRITHDESRYAINWHRIEGSVKEVVGSWKLIPDGDRTVVIYKVRLDPGIPLVPVWAIDWGTKQVAPDIIRSIRRQVK
ncbi:MAG TPA: SRPBCC family protein [Stenomitos sp.]